NDRRINLVTDSGPPSHQQRYEHHREAAHAHPLDETPEGNFTKGPLPAARCSRSQRTRSCRFFGKRDLFASPADVQALRQLADDGSDGARWAGRMQLWCFASEMVIPGPSA